MAKMITGRYRTERQCRFWSNSNKEGYCLAPTCVETLDGLEHLLFTCPALQSDRQKLMQVFSSKAEAFPELSVIMNRVWGSKTEQKLNFCLDPSSDPEIIILAQSYCQPFLDTIFYLTRTYIYTLHRRKLFSLGHLPTK